MGTGGVGKTSMSLAVALQAAQSGQRVASITVDPSQRLSRVLGIGNDDHKSLNWDELSGSLDVFHVKPEEVFEKFVSKHLKPTLYEKIKKNGIYQQISKNLRETHNFAALYQMDEVLHNQNYDLVVLDTPPCDQVLEFFDSPLRLQKFFSRSGYDQEKASSWSTWIQDKGTKVVEGFFEKLVGGEFFTEMENFFKVVGDLRGDISRVSGRFIDTLASPQSSIALVFSSAPDKVLEAQFLAERLMASRYHVDNYVLNRAFPGQLDFGRETAVPQDSREAELYNYYADKKQAAIALMKELKQQKGGTAKGFYLIPEFSVVMESKTQLLDFCDRLASHWQEV